MRTHRYALDIPHSPERVWALMNDDARWPEFAPYTYTMIARQPGNDQTGHLRLEPRGATATRLHWSTPRRPVLAPPQR